MVRLWRGKRGINATGRNRDVMQGHNDARCSVVGGDADVDDYGLCGYRISMEHIGERCFPVFIIYTTQQLTIIIFKNISF